MSSTSPPPSSVRQPGTVQATLLLAANALGALVTALLGPSLPAMQQHFADTPNVAYLVPLTMMVPMLTMAIFSVLLGLLSDRFGRKRLLLVATALYGVFGAAPLLLDSLAAIVASRAALGIASAAVTVVASTMIGDYWYGAQRDRYMALIMSVAAASAFLFNNLGGLLAAQGWQAPYAVFTVAWLFMPPMALCLWEPLARTTGVEQPVPQDDGVMFSPGLLAVICLIGCITGFVHALVPVHFGYLFGTLGVSDPARIGAAYGINSLGVIAGTFLFGGVLARRTGVPFQLATAAALSALGFLLAKPASNYQALTTAGAINGLGCGVLLPALVTWTMRSLPLAQRGMGNGALQSAMFFGMFANPLVVVWLQEHVGSRANATAVVGQVTAVLAVVAASMVLLQRKRDIAATVAP